MTTLERVPSMVEMVARGLARQVTESHYRLTEQGQQMIYDIQERNARRLREDDALRKQLERAAFYDRRR